MRQRSELLLQYLTKAGELRSMNSKMAVLVEMLSDPTVADAARVFVHRVLDPKWNYYMTAKRVPEPEDRGIEFAKGADSMEDLFAVTKMLHNREVTGQAATNLVAQFLHDTSVTTRVLFQYAIMRQLPGNIGRTLINKVQPGLIYKQPYGGVKPWDPFWAERRFKFDKGVYIQNKADGMTLMIDLGTGEVRTRQGQDVTLQMQPYIKPLVGGRAYSDAVLHCEAMLWDCSLNAYLPRPVANGEFNALFKGEHKISPKRLVLIGLDVIDSQIFYGHKSPSSGEDMQSRFEILSSLAYMYNEAKPGLKAHFGELPDFTAVKTGVVYSLDDAREYTQRIIAAGGEGAILKDPDGKWSSGKMTCQMKMKNEFECTLLCVGVKPHTKQADWVGSLHMVSSDDRIDSYVGSGLNEEAGSPLDRTQGPEAFVGSLFEIRAEKISKNNALDLPRVIEPRLDKTEADTYKEVEDAYQDSISLLVK